MSDATDRGFAGSVSIVLDEWTLLVQNGLPTIYDSYCDRAALVETFDLDSDEGAVSFVAAGRSAAWPVLVVAQRYAPSVGGFDPGVALVPETSLLFVGAGTRLLAYDLAIGLRLWEDAADIGFWHWSLHTSAVLMAAELEFAAWDRRGSKLWSRFVEPPWDYSVVGERVHLDVMGTRSEFDIRQGPSPR